MPRFPTKEMDIIELAQLVANGIKDNPTDFPNAPATPTAIETLLTSFFAKNEEGQLAKAAWMTIIQDKGAIFENIVSDTKANIGYAEIVAKGDNAKLKKISWGTRAAPTALAPPGQCRVLEIIGQGDGWMQIDWKEPIGGGEVASYIIQRSQNGTSFSDVGVAVDSIALLSNQPSG